MADRNTPQKLVWRSRIVLLSADRVGKMAIVRAVGKCKRTVDRWQERYVALAGLPGCSGTLRVVDGNLHSRQR